MQAFATPSEADCKQVCNTYSLYRAASRLSLVSTAVDLHIAHMRAASDDGSGLQEVQMHTGLKAS